MDVERSLYTFAGFLDDQERSARRQELERLLNAVVVKHEGMRAGLRGLPYMGARGARHTQYQAVTLEANRRWELCAGSCCQAACALLTPGGSLAACMLSVCCAGTVHYYQGLHDVASVLLLVAGEPAAFDILCHLATGHLRDATRSSLDPVIELLGLMGPIVAAADPELASYLAKQGLPPFYALSWFITWFSHDLADFGEVRGAGLMAAAVVVGNRRRLAR